jgi:hypothetical protein
MARGCERIVEASSIWQTKFGAWSLPVPELVRVSAAASNIGLSNLTMGDAGWVSCMLRRISRLLDLDLRGLQAG